MGSSSPYVAYATTWPPGADVNVSAPLATLVRAAESLAWDAVALPDELGEVRAAWHTAASAFVLGLSLLPAATLVHLGEDGETRDWGV